ncbi:hypothetical protein MHBO_000701 [Bonamia ostreae]|uniref:NADH dehydrogenase subunit 4L n=1 Tax=Bonamia ostreae TaxID=126728 RepID=A0ABV2AGM5_9EUKA
MSLTVFFASIFIDGKTIANKSANLGFIGSIFLIVMLIRLFYALENSIRKFTFLVIFLDFSLIVVHFLFAFKAQLNFDVVFAIKEIYFVSTLTALAIIYIIEFNNEEKINVGIETAEY